MTMKNDGFSLLELLTVLVIVGVLSAVAVPGLGGWVAKRQLNASARSVAGHFQRAKSEAIRANQEVVVSFDQSNERYSFGPSFLPTQSLPAHIGISTANFSGDLTMNANSTGFNGRGFSLQSGSVTIVSSKLPSTGSPPHNARLISLTTGGSISITP